MRAKQWTCLAVLLLIASPLFAQNPWTRVPPFPSSCYQANDAFGEDVGRVEGELSEAIERQKVSNEEIALRWTNLNPEQQQARLMEFMQKNPAGAADAVQQLQSGFGAEVTGYPSGKLPADFQAELRQLSDEYLAEYRSKLSPKPLDDRTRWAAWNASYQALCVTWFGSAARQWSDGRFSGFLARYREYLSKEYIPLAEENHAARKRFFETMGIRTAGFESPAPMDAVRMYLQAVGEVFGGRETKPLGS